MQKFLAAKSARNFCVLQGRTLVITQLCVRASFFTAGMYLDFEVNSILKDIICADS